ncbi:patatin-like phospholipase family protein [Dysgonomonas sp. Marseille-P4677]|uniref:patatin-like phospholipase family protein n=1 Tax=Dysgonomonas sp. Marseille-P4677 TaxID=2364790 RepID=UPI00191393B8|nr:patatin-like phospholipase family protein [Dysgonomonas sp. Marseille-P4677]MBK5720865.1 patatin-like phospholipase family protein [Dysgonomonas sp. Marseille-P4677]
MNTNKSTYNLGVALSGGGAKGFAHLGVLQALNEKGLYPDIISGTSAGAFAGALYADGYTPEEIISFFKKKVFREFAEFAIPHGGFFKSEGFNTFLKKYLKAKNFESLKFPLYVVATDIEYGESHIFKSGPLIPAVVASCSVPIVFRPVKINDHYYVDGGLLKNFPVSTIRRECRTIIGVNVSPIKKSEFRSSIKYIAERSFHYMSGSNTLLDRNLCDYLIESTSLSQYSMFDLDHVEDIFQAGYKLTMEFFEDKKESLIKDFPNIIS